MKRISSIFLALLIFFVPTVSHADIVGHIYKTDIKAYENFLRVPSYNCDGSTVIFARDLENYGYDVLWNEKNATVTIKRNYSKKISPLLPVFEGYNLSQTILYDVYQSSIKTFFEGREIPSYNIGGKIAIKLRSLESSGSVTFDSVKLKALHISSGTSLTQTEIAHIDYVYKILDIMALVDNDISTAGIPSSQNATSLKSEMTAFSSYVEPSRFKESSMELWWSMVNLNFSINLLSSGSYVDGVKLNRYITDSLQQRKNALAILATEF